MPNTNFAKTAIKCEQTAGRARAQQCQQQLERFQSNMQNAAAEVAAAQQRMSAEKRRRLMQGHRIKPGPLYYEALENLKMAQARLDSWQRHLRDAERRLAEAQALEAQFQAEVAC